MQNSENTRENYIAALKKEAVRWESTGKLERAAALWEEILKEDSNNEMAARNQSRLHREIATQVKSDAIQKEMQKTAFRRKCILFGITGTLSVVLIIFAIFFIVHPPGIREAIIDTKQAAFHTGIYIHAGKYKIWFKGCWNLNTNFTPPTLADTCIGPLGRPDWDPKENREWRFPDLEKMGTGIQIGSQIFNAEEENTLQIKPEWIGSEAELILLINDLKDSHWDNGPGLTAGRKITAYTIFVKEID